MSPDWIVVALAGLLATAGLVKLMHRRQEHLRGLLKSYSEAQLEWSRKKARAALLARKAAKAKESERENQEEALSELIRSADFAEKS